MDNWSEDFKAFANSALGKELIRELRENLHDNLIREAQSAKSAETAFGLLKEASGVIKSIDHINFLSVSLPKEEDSRE